MAARIAEKIESNGKISFHFILSRETVYRATLSSRANIQSHSSNDWSKDQQNNVLSGVYDAQAQGNLKSPEMVDVERIRQVIY